MLLSLGSFIVQFLLAIIALAGLVYLPGRLLLRTLDLRLDPVEALGGSLAAGMVMLTLVYWGLAGLQISDWLWVYLLVAAGPEFFLLAKAFATRLPIDPDEEEIADRLSCYWPLGVLLLIVMAAQGWLPIVSGWEGAQGLTLHAWHYRDAPWHVYNLLQLSQQYPPQVPGFSGVALSGYPIFSDLFWGAVLKIVPLNPWHIYFRIATFWYSGLMALGVFLVVRIWSGKRTAAYLAVALTALLSTFGYWLPLFFGTHHYFYWDAVFSAAAAGGVFNSEAAASWGLVLLGVWVLQRWWHGRRPAFLLLLCLFWGVLPGFQVYPALLIMAALLVIGAVRWAFDHKRDFLHLFAAVAPLFLLVFLSWHLDASFRQPQWNGQQLFYYALMVLALPAAVALWEWLEPLRPGRRFAWLGGIAALGLLCTIQAWANANWGLRVSPDLCAASAWLRQEAKPDAVILRPLPAVLPAPAAAIAPGVIQPAGWLDTNIPGALCRRNVYLENTLTSKIQGYPVAARVAAVRHFYFQANVLEARQLLEDNQIVYVLADAGWKFPFHPEGVPLKKVYANATVVIYKYLPRVSVE